MIETVREGSLGAVLSHAQIISNSDIAAALAEQQRSGCRFGEALVSLGIVTQEDIDWALSNQLGIPYIRLKQEMIDPDALDLLPAVFCRANRLIPLIRAGDELAIAIADPLDKQALQAATEQAGCRISLSIAPVEDINRMLDLCYGLVNSTLLGFSSAIFTTEQCDSVNSDLSGSHLLQLLLQHCIQHRLSGFSLKPLDDRILITGRSGKHELELGQLQPDLYPAFCSLIRTAAALPPVGDGGGNGSITMEYQGRQLTFQVLLLQGIQGDYLTIRRHIAAAVPATLSQMLLPPFQKEQFSRLAGLRQGLVLFASRSLQERCRFMDLLLEEQDTSGRAVLILGHEPGRMIKQFPRIPLPASDYGKGRLIMDALEHGPDILAVEDGTALEPFSAAARAAMRGKLVLVGMDIRGTRNLLDHLIRFRQRNVFASSLLAGIVSLKGMQLLCPSCRQPVSLPQQELENLQLLQPPTAFYHATGCPACDFTGTSERLFLTNCICFDETLRNRFETTPDGSSFMASLQADGYRGIKAEGEDLLRAGAVSPEEYLVAVIQ